MPGVDDQSGRRGGAASLVAQAAGSSHLAAKTTRRAIVMLPPESMTLTRAFDQSSDEYITNNTASLIQHLDKDLDAMSKSASREYATHYDQQLGNDSLDQDKEEVSQRADQRRQAILREHNDGPTRVSCNQLGFQGPVLPSYHTITHHKTSSDTRNFGVIDAPID